ncbi:MAG TPA: hypothetical protein VLA15_06970 [Desulfurivibrionaceae bacterium]|nr:hypothetical protein [Desulfurivibrionaceae bacterium]
MGGTSATLGVSTSGTATGGPTASATTASATTASATTASATTTFGATTTTFGGTTGGTTGGPVGYLNCTEALDICGPGECPPPPANNCSACPPGPIDCLASCPFGPINPVICPLLCPPEPLNCTDSCPCPPAPEVCDGEGYVCLDEAEVCSGSQTCSDPLPQACCLIVDCATCNGLPQCDVCDGDTSGYKCAEFCGGPPTAGLTIDLTQEQVEEIQSTICPPEGCSFCIPDASEYLWVYIMLVAMAFLFWFFLLLIVYEW